jgi:beta-N-acetylglucosaminidase
MHTIFSHEDKISQAKRESIQQLNQLIESYADTHKEKFKQLALQQGLTEEEVNELLEQDLKEIVEETKQELDTKLTQRINSKLLQRQASASSFKQ